MEEKIIAILQRVFGVENLDKTCSQKTCEQWDSMAQLNLVLELEDEFGISLEPEEIGEMTDFESIRYILEKQLSQKEGK